MSWNEWVEEDYLEPQQEFGLGWLEALAQGLAGSAASPDNTDAPESPLPSGTSYISSGSGCQLGGHGELLESHVPKCPEEESSPTDCDRIDRCQ